MGGRVPVWVPIRGNVSQDGESDGFVVRSAGFAPAVLGNRRPMERPADDDIERPDDERGAQNRIGYLNVDESDSSSERGDSEPEVEEEIDQP